MKDKELREKFDNIKTSDIEHPFSSFISLYELLNNINNELNNINIYITGGKNISKIINDYGTDFCSLEERMKSDRDQLDASKKHLNKAWGEISKIHSELIGINVLCNALAKNDNDFIKIENRITKPKKINVSEVMDQYYNPTIIKALTQFLKDNEPPLFDLKQRISYYCDQYSVEIDDKDEFIDDIVRAVTHEKQ